MKPLYTTPLIIAPICDFPYKKITIKVEDIAQRFNNLKQYKFNLIETEYRIKNIPDPWYLDETKKYNNLIIKNEASDYLTYNLISDYFTDYCRVRARRYDHALSPWEYWIKNKDYIKDYVIKKYNELNAYTLREALYNFVGESAAFRPTIAIGFIELFKAKTILDFSAGWGDRLIAAIAADVDYYCGVDPNSSLHPEYKAIISHFSTKPEKFHMIQSPFETALLPPDVSYDLIITSPPYYNLEIYCSESTQSIHNRSLGEWFDNFLLFSLDKAWSKLKSKGHMVIIINDIYNKVAYTKLMIDTFNHCHSDANYLGVISYSEFTDNKPNNPKPCWIWEKL